MIHNVFPPLGQAERESMNSDSAPRMQSGGCRGRDTEVSKLDVAS
jgi:hypothetical protein